MGRRRDGKEVEGDETENSAGNGYGTLLTSRGPKSPQHKPCSPPAGPPPVDLSRRISFSVKKLEGTTFQEQQLILTKHVLAFAMPGHETAEVIDDLILLTDIEGVKDLWNRKSPTRAEGGWSLLEGMIGLLTKPDAYNMGRSYCITASFPLEVGGR
jgi:hypothetical protein